jgi:hypothetical protein
MEFLTQPTKLLLLPLIHQSTHQCRSHLDARIQPTDATQTPTQTTSSLLVPPAVRRFLLSATMRTFSDPAESVRTDVWLLRKAPLFLRAIPVHGLVRRRSLLLWFWNLRAAAAND